MPKSVELFQQAAAKNLPQADARLAFWTSSGNEALVKDTAKAEQWGKKALADGLINKAPRNPAAQTELANTVLLSKGQLRKLSDEILS